MAADPSARAGRNGTRRAAEWRHHPVRGRPSRGVRRLQPARGLLHHRSRPRDPRAAGWNDDGLPGAGNGGRDGVQGRPHRCAPFPRRRGPPDPCLGVGRGPAARLRGRAATPPRGDYLGGHWVQQRPSCGREPPDRHHPHRFLPGRFGRGSRRMQQLPGDLHPRRQSPRRRTRSGDAESLQRGGRHGPGAPVPGCDRVNDDVGDRPRHARSASRRRRARAAGSRECEVSEADARPEHSEAMRGPRMVPAVATQLPSG